MGVIRGFFLVVVSILLFLSLFSSVLFLTLSSSLDYNNLQKESRLVLKDILINNMNISSVIDGIYPFMVIYCQTNPEYVFTSQSYTFTLPCNVTSGGKEGIIDKGIDYFIKGIYYKDYNCTFIDCFGKTELPTFLFSVKSHDFLNKMFYLALVFSLILIGLAFLLIEKKTNLFILTSILLIVSSLPLFKITSLIKVIPNEIAVKIIGLFFSSASSVSIKMLIIGIVLLVGGIILKVFKIGFSISGILAKFKKPASTNVSNIVKKPVKTKSK